VAVREKGDEVVFLHKILPGKADRSYGIQVAKIAGLPQALLQRAAMILKELENSSTRAKLVKAVDANALQPSLFEAQQTHPLIKELEELDVDNLTARQALEYLYDIVSRVRSARMI
jgi:DNA mismatch repair protein MutS